MALFVILSTESNAKDGGGSMKNSAGIEVGFHPKAQTWVQGQKETAHFSYTGYSWLAYLTSTDSKKDGGLTMSVPSIAVWGDFLTNTYHTTDPSGASAKETIRTQGAGMGYVGVHTGSGFSMATLVGVERAELNQSGDTPRTQKYPYGFSSRLGIGYAPIHGAFSLDARVDWVFKHFPSKLSNGDSLKVMQQQSFVPMVGISYSH